MSVLKNWLDTGSLASVGPAPLSPLRSRLRARLSWVAYPTLALSLLAGGWGLRQPRLYEARATLEYTAGASGTAPRGPGLDHAELREQIKTQAHIIKSRTLAERVVRKLGVRPPESFERKVQRIMRSVDVVPVEGSRIVGIHVRLSDPEGAARVANALAEMYLEKSLEDRVGANSRALQWLGTQRSELRRELEASERAAYSVREGHQTVAVSIEEQRRLMAAQRQAYSTALTELRIKHIEQEARTTVLKEALVDSSDKLAVQVESVRSDPSVMALQARFYEYEAQLTALLAAQPAGSPAVLSVKASLEATRTELAKRYDAVLKGEQASLRELERAQMGLEQALAKLEREGLELSRKELESAGLERERTGQASLYGEVIERVAQVNLERALSANTARIVDRAVATGEPVGFRWGTMAALGALVGCLAGLAAVSWGGLRKPFAE